MSIRFEREHLYVMSLIRDYILKGYYHTERPFIRSLEQSRKVWDYKNEQFEYRTQLSTPNATGTLTELVLTKDGALKRPGNVGMLTQKASYGTVIGGFVVDMFAQRETSAQPRFFDSQVDMDIRNARFDMANTAARAILGGKFMVLFQVTPHIIRLDDGNPVDGFVPTVGVPFDLRVPAEVCASGYTQGMLFIKATGEPGGPSNAREAYVLLDIQPSGKMKLLPIGEPSVWRNDDFIEAFGNRVADGAVEWIEPSLSTYPMGNWQFVGNATRYLDEKTDLGVPLVGAMEGMPDLFPWYYNQSGQRLGLDVPYRGAADRLLMTAQKAGNALLQRSDQTIMDVIEQGTLLSRMAVPGEQPLMILNPAVFPRISAEEGDTIRRVEGIQVGGRRHFGQGATTISAQVGNYNLPLLVADPSWPSDLIFIGPPNRIEQIGWGNPFARVEEFMDAEFGNTPPQAATAINLPVDIITSMDIGRLMTFSAPQHRDSPRQTTHSVKPEILTHVTMMETGALFTEIPHGFTVVKLNQPSFVGN